MGGRLPDACYRHADPRDARTAKALTLDEARANREQDRQVANLKGDSGCVDRVPVRDRNPDLG
jgi:hypothetical protein